MASLPALYVSSSLPSPLRPHRSLNSIFSHETSLPCPPRTRSSQRRTTISLSFRTSYLFAADHEDEDEQIARDFGFDEAVDLFNQGAYYDCHDVLETLWNGAEDPTRTLFHGILQCAVGLHHLFNRNHRGAMMELGEGLCKLRKMDFQSGPFYTFEREITAVLDFVYLTQIELAACDENVCVTMEGSERSYELLGRYGAGQKLYDIEKEVDGRMCIVFSPQTSQAHPLRVKLPTLAATKQHLLALDYQ
ncbi:uncharacterized protein LOC120091273 [Benincasa hispida]|uniref:uncharacterized protein LOC120091273 n=1 Tax=Benincasa hispida TaxID=102211 RepID=UPI0019000975|nr:uncharacterized protein LOC120091273 [Benincasa hispida]